MMGLDMVVPLDGESGDGVPVVGLGAEPFHPRSVTVQNEAVEVMYAVLGQP